MTCNRPLVVGLVLEGAAGPFFVGAAPLFEEEGGVGL